MSSTITDRVSTVVNGVPVSSAGHGTYICTNVAGTNDVTADTDPTIDEYMDNMVFLCEFVNDCTGAMTVDFGGGEVALLTPSGAAISTGQVIAGIPYFIRYNGTNMKIVSPF